MRQVLAVLLALFVTVTSTVLAVNRGSAPNSASAAPNPLATDPGIRAAREPEATPPSRPDLTLAGPATAAQINRGARVYRSLCLACHLPDGKGMAGLTPPLVAADYLFADRERAIHTVLKGIAGPIVVNGHEYRGVMPALEHVLTDAQVADVLTYVFNSWGNEGEAFAAAHIARRRAEWLDQPGVVAPPSPSS